MIESCCIVRRALSGWVACLFALSISGCGTLISGTHERVHLSLSPPGTQLEVYHWPGEKLAGPGTSPGELQVHRPVWNEPYLVRAFKDGHCPQYWLTSSRPSGGAWTYLWMLFIPTLGPLAIAATASLVDASTGACCAMSPDRYDASLQADNACMP